MGAVTDPTFIIYDEATDMTEEGWGALWELVKEASRQFETKLAAECSSRSDTCPVPAYCYMEECRVLRNTSGV